MESQVLRVEGCYRFTPALQQKMISFQQGFLQSIWKIYNERLKFGEPWCRSQKLCALLFPAVIKIYRKIVKSTEK